MHILLPGTIRGSYRALMPRSWESSQVLGRVLRFFLLSVRPTWKEPGKSGYSNTWTRMIHIHVRVRY